MRLRSALGVLSLVLASNAHADWLSHFDAFRCIKEVGLFEYSGLALYNAETVPKQYGIQPADEAQFTCELNGELSITVSAKLIIIEKSGQTIFSGRKLLTLIRVFADPESIDTVELCSWSSQMGNSVRLPKLGGCVYRGFPAILADGPRTPEDVLKIIERGDDL